MVVVKDSVECWLIRSDRQVLLLQVPAYTNRYDAFWQPVTGGIEDGESPIQAALREIAEETDLKLESDLLTEIASDVTVVISPELTISKTLYMASMVADAVVKVNPDELLGLDPEVVGVWGRRVLKPRYPFRQSGSF